MSKWNRDELIAMVEGGMTLAEIGRQYGVTRERIRQVIGDWKPHKRPTPLDASVTAKENAARLGLTVQAVYLIARKQGKKLKPGYKTVYSNEEIIDSGVRYMKAHGRLTPYVANPLMSRDAATYAARKEEFGFPSMGVILNRFGSWAEYKQAVSDSVTA